MQGSELDERSFFRAIAASGARVLLIGRRALIALGIPVLTADLIRTKKWAMRQKDIADIQLLTGLRDKEGSS